jgi:hypothetical protein
MKNSFKYLLFICLFGTHVFAQKQTTQTGDPNDLDERFVPDKNSVLNSANDSKNTSDKSYKNSNNAIKFNLALLGRSTVAFEWEHAFGDIVAIQAGLGICVGQDLMQKTFAGEISDAFDLGSRNGNYVKLSEIFANSAFNSPSPYLAAGLKLYFSGEAPEGSYVHFNLRYSTNNLSYAQTSQNYNNNVVFVGSPDITIKNLGFNLIYGYQVVSGSGKYSFVNDFYAGFGIRSSTYNALNITQVNNANGNYQTEYVNTGTMRSSIIPVVLLGYSLGFGW